MRPWFGILIACAIGCGDNQAGVPLELVGDWFLCDTPSCSQLKNHGARWDDDGAWVMLQAPGVQCLEATGTYCASPHDANRGVYTLDTAGTLEMTDDLGRPASQSTVTFDGATISLAQANGIESIYRRIDPPRSTGDCSSH